MAESIFVANMASATAGSIAGSPAYDTAVRLGQGDASRYFLSIGDTIERICGPSAAERGMNAMASIMYLIEMTGDLSHEAKDDLVNFMAERMKHNAERLFNG